MVVGQAGSAMASELGIRNDEQIDALQTMSVDPWISGRTSAGGDFDLFPYIDGNF